MNTKTSGLSSPPQGGVIGYNGSASGANAPGACGGRRKPRREECDALWARYLALPADEKHLIVSGIFGVLQADADCGGYTTIAEALRVVIEQSEKSARRAS